MPFGFGKKKAKAKPSSGGGGGGGGTVGGSGMTVAELRAMGLDPAAFADPDFSSLGGGGGGEIDIEREIALSQAARSAQPKVDLQAIHGVLAATGGADLNVRVTDADLNDPSLLAELDELAGLSGSDYDDDDDNDDGSNVGGGLPPPPAYGSNPSGGRPPPPAYQPATTPAATTRPTGQGPPSLTVRTQKSPQEQLLDSKSLELQNLKVETIAAKREGRMDEARTKLARVKQLKAEVAMLEQRVAEGRASGGTSAAGVGAPRVAPAPAPAPTAVGPAGSNRQPPANAPSTADEAAAEAAVSVAEQVEASLAGLPDPDAVEVTDEDMMDPEMLAMLAALGDAGADDGSDDDLGDHGDGHDEVDLGRSVARSGARAPATSVVATTTTTTTTPAGNGSRAPVTGVESEGEEEDAAAAAAIAMAERVQASLGGMVDFGAGEDLDVELTDEDMMDPEMLAMLAAVGGDDDGDDGGDGGDGGDETDDDDDDSGMDADAIMDILDGVGDMDAAPTATTTATATATATATGPPAPAARLPLERANTADALDLLDALDDPEVTRQIELVTARVNAYRRAALACKRAGDREAALDHLRTSNGCEALLGQLRNGVLVDDALIPGPPATNDGTAVSRTTVAAAPKKASPPKVSPPKVSPGRAAAARTAPEQPPSPSPEPIISRNEKRRIFVKLIDGLTEQKAVLKKLRRAVYAAGDKEAAVRYNVRMKAMDADLATVVAAAEADGPLPRFHYETETYELVRVNDDVPDNVLEMCVVRLVSVPLPKGYTTVDPYIMWEWGHPTNTPQTGTSSTFTDAANAEINYVAHLDIDRKRVRSLKTALARKKISFDLYQSRFLRAALNLGHAEVKVPDLVSTSVVETVVNLVGSNRRANGGKMELRFRLRRPLQGEDRVATQEEWIILDRPDGRPNPASAGATLGASRGRSVQRSASAKVAPTQQQAPAQRPRPTASEAGRPTSTSAAARQAQQQAAAAPVAATDDPDEDINPISGMVSLAVLEWEVDRCTKLKAQHKVQGTRPAEDLDGRIGQANMAIQILGARVEAGVLTIPQYLDQLRGGVAREMQTAMRYKAAGNIPAAKMALKRKKIMEKDIQDTLAVQAQMAAEGDE